MKKIFEFIKKIFSGAVGQVAGGIAIEQLGQVGEEALEKFYVTNPKACAAMVSSMYVWIDTIVEDITTKSKGNIDDKAVNEAKEELEEFATRHSFELTNLDAGTADD